MKTEPHAEVSNFRHGEEFPWRVLYYHLGTGFNAGELVYTGHNAFKTEQAAKIHAAKWNGENELYQKTEQ